MTSLQAPCTTVSSNKELRRRSLSTAGIHGWIKEVITRHRKDAPYVVIRLYRCFILQNRGYAHTDEKKKKKKNYTRYNTLDNSLERERRIHRKPQGRQESKKARKTTRRKLITHYPPLPLPSPIPDPAFVFSSSSSSLPPDRPAEPNRLMFCAKESRISLSLSCCSTEQSINTACGATKTPPQPLGGGGGGE